MAYTTTPVPVEKTKPPVFTERRQAPRRVINRVAQYCCEAVQFPRPCMVTNLSDSGARLYSESDMPEAFVLLITGDGLKLRRECRVVWRLGYELGVEFVESRETRLDWPA